MTLSSADSGSLLSAPLTSGVRAEVRHSRPNTESLAYENTSKQFRIDNSSKNYNSQYFKVSKKYPALKVSFFYHILYFVFPRCTMRGWLKCGLSLSRPLRTSLVSQSKISR